VAAGLLASIFFVLTILGSASALRAPSVAGAAATVASGRIESLTGIGRSSETFTAPATAQPVLRALPRPELALWLLLLAALATLAATVGLKPGHGRTRDPQAIAARCGPARLPRRRGPPALTR